MFRFIHTKETVIGGWVKADKLIEPLNLLDLDQSEKAIFVNEFLEPTNYQDFLAGNGVALKDEISGYYMTGAKEKFLVVSQKSDAGKFSLMVIIPDKVILESLSIFNKFISFFPLFTIVFAALYVLYIRKAILSPIKMITQAMVSLKYGDLNTYISLDSSSDEFSIMNSTFNNMILEIKNLKIKIYEEKIDKQRVELKHLQLQINPHFFLNSLNIIYQLANLRDYKLIQEMSFCLIEYFRFMFRSNLAFVSIEEEINHTRNYLRIQQMRFPEHLTYKVTAMDSLLTFPIPPLAIQTFVENSIKYSVNNDTLACITVDISHEPSSSGMVIIVKDKGDGFNPADLEKFNRDIGIEDNNGEHIGIWNVRRRLSILYGETAWIRFYNSEQGGACVEMHLPTKSNF
jgi:two-component system sensor histidine kinase YesM